MATFTLPRFLENAQERAEHAKALAQVVAESAAAGEKPDVERERKRFHADPVDALALRGLPAVGRGCAGGVIRGTNPESALIAKQPRE